ncbi:MAG: VirB4 family type IV secretion system protein [Sulfobacillus sp.]
MVELIHPIPVRWLTDEDLTSLQSQDLNFLLSVSHDLKFWYRSRPLSEVATGTHSYLNHLARSRLSPSIDLLHMELHLLTPGHSSVHSIARHLHLDRPDPLLTAPCSSSPTERLRHLSGATGDITMLMAVRWPAQVSPDLLAPLFTFPTGLDLLVDCRPLPAHEATRMLRHRLRVLRPHSAKDPTFQQAAQDAEALLSQVVGRMNRLFRVGLVAAVSGSPAGPGARSFQQLAQGLGFTFSPVPFQQAKLLTLFGDHFSTMPPLVRMLDAQTIIHLGLYEWSAPPISDRRDLFIGIDPDHRCLVSHDRRRANPSAFVLGLPGSGKSTFSKVELLRRLESTQARAIVFDPEGEYELLVRHLQGMSIPIGTNSGHLNPLAAPQPGDLEGKLLRIPPLLAGPLGSAEVLRLRLLLTDCYRQTTAPTFRDLLRRIPSGDPLYPAVWPYAEGPLRGFSGPLRRFPDHRIISFNLAQADAETVAAAVPLLLELVGDWLRTHRQQGYPLSVTLDEVHLFLHHPQVRQGLLSFLKRSRKAGVSFTGITQNVGDFLLADDGRLMLSNAGMLVLFRQSADDLRLICERYQLSHRPAHWLSLAQPGQALLIDDGVRPVRLSLSSLEASITDTTPISLR